jgi:hypothetical protein
MARKNRGVQLGTAAAAERAGCAASTWRGYVSRGYAPKPDGHHDARTPWWYEATVDEWKARRPGAGARTDLKK